MRTRTIRHFSSTRLVCALSDLAEVEWALLDACSGADWDLLREASIPQLFADRVCTDPQALVPLPGGGSATYAELWTRSGAVAARLRQAGIRRGHVVGLHCEPADEMMVGILGILRSGGAYVRMEPGASPERLAYLRNEVGLRVFVVGSGTTPPDGVHRVVTVGPDRPRTVDTDHSALLEDDPFAAGPDDLAYLIYHLDDPDSSGPAVVASHRNVLSLLADNRQGC
jgi:non-ribosomal peptide synthetase component F